MDLRGVSHRRAQRRESEQSQSLALLGQFRRWRGRSTARGPKRWSRRGGVAFATDRTKVRRHPRRVKTGGSTSPTSATVPTLLPTPLTVVGCSPFHGPPQPTSAWTPSRHQQRSTCIRRIAQSSIPITRGDTTGADAIKRTNRRSVSALDEKPSGAASRLPACPPNAIPKCATILLKRLVRRAYGSATNGSRSVKTCRGQPGLSQKNLRLRQRTETVMPCQGRSRSLRW